MSKKDEKTITLTAEEAKRVRIAIAIAMLLTKSARYKKELPKLFGQIDKRIKQAEKENADN